MILTSHENGMNCPPWLCPASIRSNCCFAISVGSVLCEKYGETLVACVLGGIVVVWGLGLYFFVDGLVIDPEDIEPVIDFNAFVSE